MVIARPSINDFVKYPKAKIIKQAEFKSFSREGIKMYKRSWPDIKTAISRVRIGLKLRTMLGHFHPRFQRAISPRWFASFHARGRVVALFFFLPRRDKTKKHRPEFT